MLKEGFEGLRIPSGCAISGIFSKSGKRFSGENIIKSIRIMHERSNGLGGGFAAYGIYPDFKEHYAFHIFYNQIKAKEECECYLRENFNIAFQSEIPTRKHPNITDQPLIWRYFAKPIDNLLETQQLDEKEFVARIVTHVNTYIDGAFIFSSGKDMGVFKGGWISRGRRRIL